MGCKYLCQRAVQDFLAGGGDEAWVKEGISATPPFLQKIARLSGNLAYNTPALMLSGCFGECPSGKEKEQLFEGLVVLAYYQCLSCLSTAGGLADGVELQNRVGWVSTRYFALLSPPILSVLYELVPQPNFLGPPCSFLLLLKLGSSATDGGTG